MAILSSLSWHSNSMNLTLASYCAGRCWNCFEPASLSWVVNEEHRQWDSEDYRVDERRLATIQTRLSSAISVGLTLTLVSANERKRSKIIDIV